jgi:hypothetical protein
MSRSAWIWKVVCGAAVAGTLCASVSCTPASPAEQERSGGVAFDQLAILPAVEFSGAPAVILGSARDFRDLCREAEVDRILGRMDQKTGVWLDFALVSDGVFYVLPARGYHTPADRLDGERLQVADAKTYYDLKRNQSVEYRHRYYFVE